MLLSQSKFYSTLFVFDIIVDLIVVGAFYRKLCCRTGFDHLTLSEIIIHGLRTMRRLLVKFPLREK